MKFNEKICSKMEKFCCGTNCAQFASCMILEIEAMEDLGIDPADFEHTVVNAIKEFLS